ncbi:hypothetical protein [Geomicrobium sp. JCM 19055]|uniref:hypothetical protein n=1 Tax=Geomicrobium sp. JCM 19055 TaxID=1460649 RepID=UPI0005AA7A7D|nr:hypothetical protein [Geomicrobium sp. JCM 19055]
MCRTTLKDHLLIFDEDLHFNQRIGMPVQVFCLTQQRVVAFGKIQNISNKCVTVSKTAFFKITLRRYWAFKSDKEVITGRIN